MALVNALPMRSLAGQSCTLRSMSSSRLGHPGTRGPAGVLRICSSGPTGMALLREQSSLRLRGVRRVSVASAAASAAAAASSGDRDSQRGDVNKRTSQNSKRPKGKKQGGRSKGRGGRNQRHMQINKQLTDASSTLEALLGVVEESLSEFNHVNVSTALSRMQRKLPGNWRRSLRPETKERVIVAVNNLGKRLVEKISSCGSRDLATSAHAFGKIAVRVDKAVLEAIEASAAATIESFSPKELSITCWAFAKMGKDAPGLFGAAVDSLGGPGHPLEDFSAHSLSLVVWGLATSGTEAPGVLTAASREASSRLHEFSAQNLSSLAWGYATARHRDPELLSGLASEATARLREFTPQGISMLVWAVAKLDVEAAELFEAVAAESRGRLQGFKPQELSTVAWAFSRAGARDPELFRGIADEILTGRRIEAFGPQDLSNTMYAFAKAGVAAPALFEAAAAAAAPQLPWFCAQALSNSAWAVAASGANEPRLLGAIAREASGRLDEFSPQNLSNLAWSFAAAAGVEAPEDLFRAIADEGTLRIREFTPQALGNVAYAFAASGVDSSKLYHALAVESVHQIAQMNQQEMSNLVWALATSRRSYPELLEAVHAEASRRGLQTFAPQALANMAWSFAILHHEPKPEALLGAARQRALDVPGAFSAQELANILHALAIYDCLDAPTIKTFVARMAASDLDAKVCHSLYQSCLAVQLRSRETAVEELLPSNILGRAEELWMSEVSNTTHSALQTQVLETLLGMGLTCKLEWPTADGRFSVDIMLEKGNELPVAVAVEVDGPSHYTKNSLEKLGPSRLRHRLVEARVDNRLIEVPFYAWKDLQGKRGKEDYLRHKLLNVCYAAYQVTAAASTPPAAASPLGGSGGPQQEELRRHAAI